MQKLFSIIFENFFSFGIIEKIQEELQNKTTERQQLLKTREKLPTAIQMIERIENFNILGDELLEVGRVLFKDGLDGD